MQPRLTRRCLWLLLAAAAGACSLDERDTRVAGAPPFSQRPVGSMMPSGSSDPDGVPASDNAAVPGVSSDGPGGVGAAEPGQATRLTMGDFPSAGLVGSPLERFVVRLENDQGDVVQQGGEDVGLVIEAGPAGAQWVGFATAELRDGAALFDSVGIDRPGTYQVYAAFNRLRSESVSLEVEAPAFTRLSTNLPGLAAYGVLAASHELLYVTNDEGIFRSDNVGVSWSRLGFGIRNSPGALRISPADPDVLYAMPGEMTGFEPELIARTLNRGVTWRPLRPPPFTEPMLDVALDDRRSRFAWACGASGVHRSDDTGDHWVQTPFEGECGAIVFGGPAPGALYAYRADGSSRTLLKSVDDGESWQPGLVSANAVRELHAAASGAVFAVSLETLQRSDDGGSTWSLYATSNLSQLVSAPSAPERLYAITDRRVRVSTDAGATFDEGVDLVPWTPSGLSVDPSDALRVYAATSGGLLVSTDGGMSWGPPSSGLGEASDVVFHPTVPGRILAAGGSLFRSDDAGDSWTRLESIPSVTRIDFHPDDPALAYACGGGGVYETRDGGEAWNLVASGVGCNDLAVDGATIWIGGPSGVVRSVDGGITWTAPLLEFPTYQIAASLGGGTLYVSTNAGSYRSTDAGDSWVPMFTLGLQVSLAMDPTRPSLLWASVCQPGPGEPPLRLSANSGDTWSAPPSAPGSFPSCAQALAFAASGTVFVLGERLYSSRDAGATWAASAATDRLTRTDGKLVISPDESTIFVASDLGLFRARNTGL